jgi:hypothetical protein
MKYFLDNFPQKYSNIEFNVNSSVGAEFSMREEGKTDMTKLIFAFRNFINAPEKKKNLDRIFKFCLHFRIYFDGGIVGRVAV